MSLTSGKSDQAPPETLHLAPALRNTHRINTEVANSCGLGQTALISLSCHRSHCYLDLGALEIDNTDLR